MIISFVSSRQQLGSKSFQSVVDMTRQLKHKINGLKYLKLNNKCIVSGQSSA